MANHSSAGAGRKIKREFPRTEQLHIRISKEHLELLNKTIQGYESKIISQADIIENAIEYFSEFRESWHYRNWIERKRVKV